MDNISDPTGPKKHVIIRSTALNFNAWENELPQDYEHREFLFTGIKNGFHIVDPANITKYVEVENYRSATAEGREANLYRTSRF